MTGTAAESVTGSDLTARFVAAHGLAGSMLDGPTTPMNDEGFAHLVSWARMWRMTGQLWSAIADGALPVTPAQAEEAESLHVRASATALVLERLLLQTEQALCERDIEVKVLKGTAVAHLDYPDPSVRMFGDVDLLVRPEAFDDAVSCLKDQGHLRVHPQPRAGFDRRFGKGTSFRTRDGLEIDLHRSFTMGPFGVRLDIEALWERHDSFTLAGHSLSALATEERFLHSCYHAVLGEVRPRIVPLRDVAQMALAHRLDLERLHGLIRSSRGEAVVARAVQMAWREFHIADILAISAWAVAYRTDPRQAAEIAVYGHGSSYARKSLAALRSLPRPSQRAAYLYALLMPDRSYLGTRHRGRLDRLRVGYRQARPVKERHG